MLVDISCRLSRMSISGPRSEVDRRTYTNVVFRPLRGRTGAVPLKFKRAPTPELVMVPREASSLSRQLQADLADFPQQSSQDSQCGNSTQR